MKKNMATFPILVVGLGSMGRRRIRLLRSIDVKIKVIGVDISDERRAQAENELGIETCAKLPEAIAQFAPKSVVVSTSPLSHGPIVLECLQAGMDVFTELNLVSDWYKEAMKLAKRKKLKLFVSSTFMYRRETNFVAKTVRGKKVNYIYHSGQYLPDWHPWEDYRSFFVSNKRTNACREIMAIELPWMIRAFGEIETLHVMKDKVSALDIDFPDNYIVSIKHKNGNKGVFCQDVVSRRGLRRLEVYSEKMHLFWEGTPQTLSLYDIKEKSLKDVYLYDDVEQNGNYNANIIENMYRDELKAFLAYVRRGKMPPYTFADDLKVLALIDGIESGEFC